MSAPAADESGFTFYRRVFALVTMAVLAVLLYRIVAPFLAPLAWATVLGYLMHPLQARLARRWRGRDGLAALTLTVLTFVLLIGPLTLLGAAFANEVGALVQALQRAIAELRISSLRDLADLPAAQQALAWVDQHLGLSAEQLRGWLVTGAEQALQPLASLGGRAFLGALGTIVDFTMMMFLLFFVLRDGRAFYGASIGLVPLEERHKLRLAHHLGDVTRAVVFGTLATSVLQGISVAIGFLMVGLPSPVVFGVVSAVLSVLPVGGTAFVWGPGAAWLIATGHAGAGCVLLAWGILIVGLADNLLRPLLISGRSQVPTLAVFIGVLGGLAAFGMVGMFLGPLLI
ncbi:MAG: AI-2E family transporter, partial [Proteobacteria bacterium]|nr:AI-2E family transporter [Pseudomonadota bacterium]